MEFEFYLFFLIGLILHLFATVFLLYFSYYSSKTYKLKPVYFVFLILGISYVVAFILYSLWTFSLNPFSSFDFSLINSLLLAFRVILLLIIFSYIFHNDKILLFGFFYILIVSAYVFSLSFNIVLFVISIVIVLIISLIIYSKKDLQKVGLSGIGYTFLFSILLLLNFLKLIPLRYIILIMDFFFLLFVFELVFFLKHKKDILLKKRVFREESSFLLNFLKYFVFIIVLVNFVFVSTVSIHELGHFGIANLIGCSSTKIVYERGLPHTEILCGETSIFNYYLSIIGGLFLPIIVSFFLFFSGGKFIHEIGFLVLGFNFLISYRDIIDFGFSETVSLFVSIVGLLIVIISIGLLVSSRVEEQQFLKFTEGHKDFYMENDT